MTTTTLKMINMHMAAINTTSVTTATIMIVETKEMAAVRCGPAEKGARSNSPRIRSAN